MTASKSLFGFPKSEKLKSPKIITSLFTSDKHVFVYPFKVFYKKKQTSSLLKPQVLFSVPKRIFKKAVDRNWIRRRMKEAYRLNNAMLADDNSQYSFESLAFIYIAKDKIPFEVQEAKIQKVFKLLLEK